MKLIAQVVLGASVLASAPLAQALAAPAARAATGAPVKVTSVEGITEYRLANGMRVLLFPDASKPTLTTNIVYMVGSRHENYGETGMAHLLEHLLFKPTANFGIRKGTLSPVEVLNGAGADFNGTTWYDRTNYYATFPANDENLKQMLALEADRMVNAPISQDDLWNARTSKGEMTVVRNEFEMGESEPIAVTTERLQAVAFDWHNYGKSTIGARSDIEKVDIARLRAFYKRYYQPDNALLMVAGRFDEAKVLQQVNALFGRIPRPARVLQPTYTREPVQDGERSVTVRRSGGSQFVGAGYHVPPSGHDDAAAMALLARILVDAPSGRLHKALVETRLATGLHAEAVSNLEPGYRIFGALVPIELSLDVAQAALIKVLEKMASTPITEQELARAKQALLKQIELDATDTSSLTIALTESMAAGDWRLFFIQRDRIEALTAAQVQAAAVKYFKPSNRTLGRFVPTDMPDRVEIPDTPNIAKLVAGYQGRVVAAQGEAFDASAANIEARTTRFTLPNGLKGALLPKKTKGAMVNVTLQLQLGTEEALRGKADAGALVTALLTRGTARLSRQQVRDELDRLRTRLSISGSATGVSLTLMSNRDNIAAAMALVAELLRTPSFPDAEFAEVQREQANDIAQQMPEPQDLASNALSRLMDATPPGHVNHVLTLPEKLAAVKAVRVADVRAFHQQFYGAEHATVAAVGEFDAAAFRQQVETLFGGWKSAQPFVRIPTPYKDVAREVVRINTPDKANSMLLMLHPLPIRNDDPAYPALLMANHMLGGGALRSRLADRVRQKEGLSYGVGSQLAIDARDPAGMWIAYAISAPENTARVEAALREEVALALKGGFTQEELVQAKKGWRQAEEVARTDDTVLSARLADYLSYGRTMLFDRDLEAKVAALDIAQVNAALRRLIAADRMSVVSAGDAGKTAPK